MAILLIAHFICASNVEMRNYFSLDNNVKFELIPYIDLQQTYLQMIGYIKKKSNFQLAISKKQLTNSKKQYAKSN